MTATVHDGERTCLAALLTEAVKYSITRMPDARARQSLWQDYSEWLQSAPAATERDAMPWDEIPSATDPDARLSVPVVNAAVTQMLRRAGDAYGRQLATAAGRDIATEMDRLESGPVRDYSGLPRCRKCGKRCKTRAATYCSDSCRTTAWQARKRAERRAREQSRAA